MITPVEVQNTMAIPAPLKRKILCGSLIYMGIIMELGAQMQVSVNHAPNYDIRWILAGAAVFMTGLAGIVAERICTCREQRDLLPV